MKKYLILFLLLGVCTHTAHARSPYFLRENEILLDSQMLPDNRVELFTQFDNTYYRQVQYLQDHHWHVAIVEPVQPPPGGLKEEQLPPTESIEKSLEERLRAQGFDPDALPSRTDLSTGGKLPPVGKQHEDSCVGWATGYYLRTFQQASDIGWQVKHNPKRIFSPSFIYNQINEGIDEGSTLQDAGNLLKNIGAATLADFPYIPKDYHTLPSPSVIERAAPHKIRSWRVLYTHRDSEEYIIRKTKEYLLTGDLPVVGINIGFKWKYPLVETDGTHFVTTEQYATGGHAVVVVGYDDTLTTPEGKGAFKIINSYGEEWGNKGYIYMTYPAFAHAIRSGFVYTDLPNQPADSEISDLPFNVQQTIECQIVFEGSGTYDLLIKDPQGKIIRKEIGQAAHPGINLYIWDGNDQDGQTAPPGSYMLEIIPYHQGVAQSAFQLPLLKENNLSFLSAKKYALSDSIYKIAIHLTTLTDSTIQILSDTQELLQKTILSNEMFFHTLDPESIDRNLYIILSSSS